MNGSNKEIYYEEDEIDLRELFNTITRNRKFIIIFTTVVTLIALIYAFMAPKVL